METDRYGFPGKRPEVPTSQEIEVGTKDAECANYHPGMLAELEEEANALRDRIFEWEFFGVGDVDEVPDCG
jgi:hypothetical protein